MIVALLAAALASTAQGPQIAAATAPCHAAPTLCLAPRNNGARQRLLREDGPRPDSKWDAFRFNARPCRLIGHLDCPRRGQRQIFRLGEPIGRTLTRSFGLG